MKVVLTAIGVGLVLAGAGAAAIWHWDAQPAETAQERLPPTPPPRTTRPAVTGPDGYAQGQGKPATDISANWPQFRGPNRDGISPDATPLLDRFDSSGPPMLWSRDLGPGYAGASIRDGRVYVLDYDTKLKADVFLCLSLADGQEIWRTWYNVALSDDHGYSRTVPTVGDGCVIALDPVCRLICVDSATGKHLWVRDLVNDYDAKVPLWYAGQCPIIDRTSDGRQIAVVAVGGTKLLAAFDCRDGSTVWETPVEGCFDPRNAARPWDMTHSSIMPMTVQVGGKTYETYVYPAVGGVVGVSRADGAVLWRFDNWQVAPANVPTPVPLGANRVLISGGYGAGGVLLEIAAGEGGAGLSAREVRRFTPDQLSSYQQTPVFHRTGPDDPGVVYAVLDKDAGELREQLVCLDREGKLIWSSGRSDRFGWGPYAIADGKILLLNDTGVLSVVRASPTGYELLARAKVLAGRESWAPPAIAGGRLIVRDFRRMVCLDLRRK